MKTMPAGEFKARCLRVMEDVRKYRVPVVITKKGRPVAKLVPPDEPRRSVFGCHVWFWLAATPTALSRRATAAIAAAISEGGLASPR